MTTINFNNQPYKIVSESEIKAIMNSIGLNWHGIKYLSINDREIFEDKTDACIEIIKDGIIRLHDLNFAWQD